MMIMAKPLLRRCPVLLASWAVACSSLATPAARTLRQRCMYHQPLSCHGAAFAQLSMNTSEQGRGRRFSSSSRGGGGGGSSASTAAQKRSNVPPGTPVLVVQKQHQRSGELTRGTVARNLTNSGVHPRGQKVMLTSGVVGRVHTIEKTPGAAAFTTLATDAPDDSGSVETSLPLTIPEADGLDAQQSRGSRHQRQGRDQEAGTGRRWTYVAGALVEEEQAQSAPGTSARYVRGQRGNKRQ
eukprot:TRINITY_DN667_c0_g1_i2.p1 TRINITY_DN667_c0_g1~~TRINITY_DN667_c0_g1_i2.p1  ORF type:complete len:258 (+),score=34.21 TRINITY_DN667_c0_g1_i2:55-774(+)